MGSLGSVSCFCFCRNSTSVCVQKAFHRLKVSRVPSWSLLSYGGLGCSRTRVSRTQAALTETPLLVFTEIIDFLQAEVVPGLKDQLKKLRCEEPQPEPQPERMYLLSEICSEDDFTEVDNSV